MAATPVRGTDLENGIGVDTERGSEEAVARISAQPRVTLIDISYAEI